MGVTCLLPKFISSCTYLNTIRELYRDPSHLQVGYVIQSIELDLDMGSRKAKTPELTLERASREHSRALVHRSTLQDCFLAPVQGITIPGHAWPAESARQLPGAEEEGKRAEGRQGS